jgi:hypothetical protein
MSMAPGIGAAAPEGAPSYEFRRCVTAVVLHVVHGRLIGVEQGMFPVVERVLGLIPSPDKVIGIGVLRGLLVVTPGGIMVAGGNVVAGRSTELHR